MLKSLCCFLLVIVSESTIAQYYNVQIEITSLPDYHPSGSEVFIAGSFNGWNPSSPHYRFTRKANGNYEINLKLEKSIYGYKITRGGWEKGEIKKGGSGMENRDLVVEGDMSVQIGVEEWQDRFPLQPPKSTAGPHVQIIDTAFLIPQLNRTRRVWVYLPADYTTTRRKYPVIYMHDGQNVFDNATSYSGEWGVDEALDSLPPWKQCIVVAVDHGGTKRMNEYNPFSTERFGKGEGDAYAKFLVKTLKPFVDRRFRTLKKENYIAGSSMGGLISLHAMLEYPKVFKGAGIFSPAFWLAPGINDDIAKRGKKIKGRLYFFAGKLESGTMVQDMLNVFENLRRVSKAEMSAVIRDQGRHNEQTWKEEFPLFYNWVRKL